MANCLFTFSTVINNASLLKGVKTLSTKENSPSFLLLKEESNHSAVA